MTLSPHFNHYYVFWQVVCGANEANISTNGFAHGIVIGAVLNDLGGTGFGGDNTTIWSQTLGQLISVVVTIVWTGAVAWFGFFVAHKLTGIRVSRDEERQGLDLASHGERAYNY